MPLATISLAPFYKLKLMVAVVVLSSVTWGQSNLPKLFKGEFNLLNHKLKIYSSFKSETAQITYLQAIGILQPGLPLLISSGQTDIPSYPLF